MSSTVLQAVRAQLDALQAEVDDLRSRVVFTEALGDAIEARGYRAGRESVLGHRVTVGGDNYASPKPRPSHLRAVR